MVPTPSYITLWHCVGNDNLFLNHQISRTFQDLSKGYQFNSNVAFSDHPLLITKSTHLVVATPTKLCQYDFKKALRDVQFVCFDEADSLFCGGHQKASWDILKTFAPRRSKRQRVEEEEGRQNFQLILTAATLPSKTPKSVGYLLRKCLPRKTIYVDTDNTHQVLSSSQFKFKRVTGTASSDEKFDLFMDELLASGNSDDDQSQKVLVFCNTVENAEKLHDNLMKWSSSSSSSDHWWSGKAGLLHKHISPEERLSLVQKFNANELKVLISTDVSSRGLDIPDISSVFMYDFPTGTVDFLHRAGRTARAGKPGKGVSCTKSTFSCYLSVVISFVTSTDEDLARAIEESIKEGSTHTNLSHLFSRNKMLRRKFKRQAEKREVEKIY